jgi:hypothetical protein
MPTRVSDLGITEDGALETPSREPVRLVNSINVIGDRRYACLSHRWSLSGHTLITKQTTYERHMVGIRYQDLDLAFQDTVHIMRRLGVRYLWIDSLCIIQDNDEDWRTESKSMAIVYNKALFTLARHCDSKTSLGYTPDVREIVSDPSVSPPVYARIRFKHIWGQFRLDEDFYESSLLDRAWVYQERLLSPRVVHFSDTEISGNVMKYLIVSAAERTIEASKTTKVRNFITPQL